MIGPSVEERARAACGIDAPLVDLRQASGIRPVPIRWLWPGWLARGKLQILAGPPGVSKTTLAMHIAACVTTGSALPGGYRPAPGNVLVWSGEDDPADTLVPRLLAAGADLRRVYFVGDTREGTQVRNFDPATDIPALAVEADAVGGAALIVVDPIVSAVAGDSHKNGEVRRALQPLVTLADRLGAAVLGITHFSKGTAGRDPTERVTGSVAFGALARVVLVAAKSENDDGPERVLVRSKSNIGPDGGGFGYAVEQTGIGQGLEASRIVWGAPLDGSAREVLGSVEAAGGARDDAVGWLEDALLRGPLAVAEIKRESGRAGMSWRTLERAKTELGAVARRVHDGATRGAGHWVWELPTKAATTKTANPITDFGGVKELDKNQSLTKDQTFKTVKTANFRESPAVADLKDSAAFQRALADVMTRST